MSDIGAGETFVDMRAVARQIVWDTGVKDPECHAVDTLGLVPLSEEGQEYEREASSRRRKSLMPIVPILNELSVLITSTMLSIHFDFPHLEGEPDQVEATVNEVVTRNAAIYENAIRCAIVTALTNLVDMGTITLNVTEKTGGVRLMEREKDES